MSKIMSNYSNLYIDTALKDYNKDFRESYSHFIHPQSVHSSNKFKSIPLQTTPKIIPGSFSSRNSYVQSQHPSSSSHFSNYSNNNYIKTDNKHISYSRDTNENIHNNDNNPPSQKNTVNSNSNIATININGMNISGNLPKNSTNSPTLIDINDLLGKDNKKPISLDTLNIPVNNFEQSKFSSKSMGIIRAYGANTHPGIVRNYNEDRVSIIINMNKPQNYKALHWPKVSFFGIYDGHGGYTCAEYLRDNLHKFIVQDQNFPNNIPEAICQGFALAERDFLSNYALSKHNENVIDRSGSCAVILMIVDNKCYVANVGDSRAIMSTCNGEKIKEITIDHKPDNPTEKLRIIDNGGKVYQSQTPIPNFVNQILIGPYRVLPGRLSVSRTLGDVEAKKQKFGGLPNVIIAIPEIFLIDIEKEDIDFIVMGCDGIFDQMSNKDVIESAWMIFNQQVSSNNNGTSNNSIHSKCGKAVDLIIKSAMQRKSFDNVTCLLIALKDFKNLYDTAKSISNTITHIISPLNNIPTSYKEYKGNYELSKYSSSSSNDNQSSGNKNNTSNSSLTNVNSENSHYTSAKPTKSYKGPIITNKKTIAYLQEPNTKSISPPKPKYQVPSTPKYIKYYKDNTTVTYNSFLTPTNKKITKDANQMKKKKDLVLNTNSNIYNHFNGGIIEHRCNTVKSDRLLPYENERNYNNGVYGGHSHTNTTRASSHSTRYNNIMPHSNNTRNSSSVKYSGIPFKYNNY